MTNRERAMAVLNYEPYDKLPLVHFGYWAETIEKWRQEGHIPDELTTMVYDGSENENKISSMLGFDFNWSIVTGAVNSLMPPFEREVVEDMGEKGRKVRNNLGVIELEKDGAGSIPAEIDHLLKDRESWEKYYKPRLQLSADRVNTEYFKTLADDSNREVPLALHCGSLFGEIRNILGVEGSAYLLLDDEELFDEIIDTFGTISYENAKAVFATGAKFDYVHFWEDICFKNGPLINPAVFDEKVGPHYKRITDLAKAHGVKIISVDCDGVIDKLIPTWLNNGVNTMFPIEVGTWDASIKPWREKYGKELRGVGGMNKTVFARDYKAIDAEVERLKPLVELGGYLPCPDHRIPPDAIWENVQYYCEKMRETFGK